MAKKRKRARQRPQTAAETIPGKLVKLREDREWTCSEAARQIGVAQCKLWEYEAGNELPTLRTLQKIADGYGVSLSVTFGG